MKNINNVTVIIRSVGERSELLCKKLVLEQGIPEEQIVLIRNISPSSAATLKSFEIGIERNLKWTLRVDADILLRQGSIKHTVDKFEKLPKNVFALQGYLLDKFFGGPRKGGYIYRTSLLPLALSQVPTGTAIRPDTETLKAMSQAGYPHVEFAYLTGLHDFEQNYKDIFRKCFVQAHKHLYRSELLLTIFREGMNQDPDLKVALDGFIAGLYYTGKVKIDVEQEIYRTSFEKFKLSEKAPLSINDWNFDKIETIIDEWREPPVFLNSMKYTVCDLQSNKPIKQINLQKKLKIIMQKNKKLGLFKFILYIIGWTFLKSGNFFLRLSEKNS